MSKVNRDDIGAIASRIDAQTIILIELLLELNGKDVAKYRGKYTKRYDDLAANFRDGIIS